MNKLFFHRSRVEGQARFSHLSVGRARSKTLIMTPAHKHLVFRRPRCVEEFYNFSQWCVSSSEEFFEARTPDTSWQEFHRGQKLGYDPHRNPVHWATELGLENPVNPGNPGNPGTTKNEQNENMKTIEKMKRKVKKRKEKKRKEKKRKGKEKENQKENQKEKKKKKKYKVTVR